MPHPTDGEYKILRVLWDRGASTVREVHEAVGESNGVGYTTVLKQMQVMHAKGLLKRSERFRAHVYEAVPRQSQVQRQLTATLVKQAFGGSARELLQSALAGRKVDKREIDAIRKLLDEHERDHK
jgi:BlaI family transcriptional regulator, penicillinase repressor